MAFVEKLLTSLPPIEVASRAVKRYHVTTDPGGIEPEVAKAAYEMLPALLPPEPDQTPKAAFAVVHRSLGDGSAYVGAYSWVWDNVLHFRSAAAAQPALGCPDDDMTHFILVDRRWIGCVWELAPVEHERRAWVRHMLRPDNPDLGAYLADYLPDGTTGELGH
jgi:hypothetical protein